MITYTGDPTGKCDGFFQVMCGNLCDMMGPVLILDDDLFASGYGGNCGPVLFYSSGCRAIRRYCRIFCTLMCELPDYFLTNHFPGRLLPDFGKNFAHQETGPAQIPGANIISHLSILANSFFNGFLDLLFGNGMLLEVGYVVKALILQNLLDGMLEKHCRNPLFFQENKEIGKC